MAEGPILKHERSFGEPGGRAFQAARAIELSNKVRL